MGLIFVGCAGTFEKITPEQMRFERVMTTATPPALVYERALQWIATNFRSSKAVLEYQNKEEGKIIGNGTTNFTMSLMDYPCYFTMQIDIKEGKYKVLFDNLHQDQNAPMYGTNTVTQLHGKFNSWMTELSAAIESKDKKDW